MEREVFGMRLPPGGLNAALGFRHPFVGLAAGWLVDQFPRLGTLARPGWAAS